MEVNYRGKKFYNIGPRCKYMAGKASGSFCQIDSDKKFGNIATRTLNQKIIKKFQSKRLSFIQVSFSQG
jgi:hypothetical protein